MHCAGKECLVKTYELQIEQNRDNNRRTDNIKCIPDAA